MTLVEILAVVLLVTGSFFTFLAAVGVVRMPDVYCRLSATSKAAPFGVGLILAGASLTCADPSYSLQAAVVALFLALTSPVAAHALGRAASRSGVPFSTETEQEPRE